MNLLKGAFGRLTYELIIHGVEKQDYGTYKCMISNSEGDTIQEIVLKGNNKIIFYYDPYTVIHALNNYTWIIVQYFILFCLQR